MLTPEQREKLRRGMTGKVNNPGGFKPHKWRVGVPSRYRTALTEAGIRWTWTSGGYVGLSTKIDNEAIEWIDSVEKLGYKVKYFNKRPEPEDVLVI